MLTDLQRRKLTRAFHVTDNDHNGFVESADLDRIVERLREVLRLSEDSVRYSDLRMHYSALWASLGTAIRDPKRNGITLDEWLASGELLFQSSAFARTANKLMDFLWFILDDNGDGVISLEEYTVFLEAHGLSHDYAPDLFTRLGKAPGDFLSRDDVMQLVREFCWGETGEEPGGFIFGPF